MITIIAEKPSVAFSIANVVGANERESGYCTGNGYNVTWAFGHLIQLAFPENYGFKGRSAEHLPIIPKNLNLSQDRKELKTDMRMIPPL